MLDLDVGLMCLLTSFTVALIILGTSFACLRADQALYTKNWTVLIMDVPILSRELCVFELIIASNALLFDLQFTQWGATLIPLWILEVALGIGAVMMSLRTNPCLVGGT